MYQFSRKTQAPKQLSLNDTGTACTQNADTPSLVAKLAPNNWHRSPVDRFWVICTRTDLQFGGLFYEHEVSYILGYFKRRRRTGEIGPNEFQSVAEAAIAYFSEEVAA